jgi:hypothetical protein
MGSPCTPACWTEARCTVCGGYKARDGRNGRSDLLGTCRRPCPGYDLAPKAPHLYGPHDSDRAYFDPDGWREHVAGCVDCNEGDGGES